MAYIYEMTEEEKKAQQEGAPDQTGPSAGALLGGGEAGAPGGEPAKPSSSGWTNIKSYLDANKPQIEEVAGKIGGNIAAEGEKAKQSYQDLTSGYQSKLDAATPKNTESLLASANENPWAFTQNQNNVQQFSNLRKGIFNDPGTLESQAGYGDTTNKIANAAKLKERAQTVGGQQGFLKDLSPNATTGETNLNQLLLGTNVGAREKIKQAGTPYEGLKKSLEESVAAQTAARNKAIEDVAGAKEAIKTKFVEPQTASAKKLQEEINKRVESSALDFNKNQDITNLRNFLQGKPNTLTTADLAKFGINNKNSIIPFGERWMSVDGGAPSKTVVDQIGPEGGQLKNAKVVMNPLDAVKRDIPNWSDSMYPFYFEGQQLSSGDASRQTVARPEEMQKILALQQLIGDEMGQYYNPEDLAQAGTYRGADYGQSRFNFV
jgi:hypothetical protein